MSQPTILLPEGVTASTLNGDRPLTTYRIGDTVILSTQDSIARPGLITAVMLGKQGFEGHHAVVRVRPDELPNLLAVLADLHRTAVTA